MKFPEAFQIDVAGDESGERLDRYLVRHLAGLSRTRIQQLIEAGHVRVAGTSARASYRVVEGDTVLVNLPAPEPAGIAAEDFPLDVLYEDTDLAVVNKPAGIIVHPGAGARQRTLAGALLHRFGSLSAAGGPLRPGIVHRLDKDTSGVLVIARSDEAHRALVEEFRARRVEKTYLALLHGRTRQDAGRIELPVARDLRRRTRMTTRRCEGRAARTDWRVKLRLAAFTFVTARIHTGRTHQIRVHFSALGHPIVGDTLYGAPRQTRVGKETLPPLGRFFLHAANIRFMHPKTEKLVEACAPLPGELCEFLRGIAKAAGEGESAIDAVLAEYL